MEFKESVKTAVFRSAGHNYDTELQERKRLLAESFSYIDLPSSQKSLMYQFLCDHHDVFVLSEEQI